MSGTNTTAEVTKKRITIWLDRDVINWAKAQGKTDKGYQSRINDSLRKLIDSKDNEELALANHYREMIALRHTVGELKEQVQGLTKLVSGIMLEVLDSQNEDKDK